MRQPASSGAAVILVVRDQMPVTVEGADMIALTALVFEDAIAPAIGVSEVALARHRKRDFLRPGGPGLRYELRSVLTTSQRNANLLENSRGELGAQSFGLRRLNAIDDTLGNGLSGARRIATHGPSLSRQILGALLVIERLLVRQSR